MIEHQREMSHAVHYLLEPMIKHVENNHKPFVPEQIDNLNVLVSKVDAFYNYTLHLVKEEKLDELAGLIKERDLILEHLKKLEKNQIKRIKNKMVNTRNSQLFFKMLSEIEQLMLHTVSLVKDHKDFIQFTRQLK